MSNVFNAVLTIGRDAEIRYAPSGLAILTVTGANNIGYGEKKKTNWIRCTLFGKRAEGELVNWLKKGTQIFVSGELSTHEWEKDGITKTSLELNCNVLDLVGGKRVDDNQQPAPQQRPAQARTPVVQDSYQDDFDSEIPF